MSGIPFCDVCGTILPYPDGSPVIHCIKCKHPAPISVYAGSVNEQKSRPDIFEGSKYIKDLKAKKEEDATIRETCPKCGHDELSYYTMQLRSADEGQTAFYSCPKCAHKFSVNS